jgi:hypothetical protein
MPIAKTHGLSVSGKAASLMLLALLASPPPAAASSVLSVNELQARSDVIVVGKGDFSDPQAPKSGVIRPGRVLKGVRQAEYRIEVPENYSWETDAPPHWLPIKDRVKAKFFLLRQDNGRYVVLGTDGEK